MSDLRERLIEAAGHALERGVCDLHEETGNWWGPGQECGRRVGTTAVEAILPIIETELQKRDQDHFDGLVGAESECLEETERLAGQLTEANKLLEQTIEVLEGSPLYETSDHDCCDECDWWLDKVQPLLDNLKAREKNHGSA
jgi:hypothetical protein